MTKRVFRYFFDFVDGQEKWLNLMAEKGYRLKKCGTLFYEFENCSPGEYEYAVEFVADKSYWKSKEYREFIESTGLRTFTKNINVNFVIGKVKWRPWAKGMGQLATSPGSFNKELLIVEKKKDGKPFKLHTDLNDLISGYRTIRNAYLWNAGCMFGLIAMGCILSFYSNSNISMSGFTFWGSMIAAVFGILWSFLGVKYSTVISKLKEESKTNE